jgi:hypothetical protein
VDALAEVEELWLYTYEKLGPCNEVGFSHMLMANVPLVPYEILGRRTKFFFSCTQANDVEIHACMPKLPSRLEL